MKNFICKHKDKCICMTCKNSKCRKEQCSDCRILGYSLPTTVEGRGCQDCVYVAK